MVEVIEITKIIDEFLANQEKTIRFDYNFAKELGLVISDGLGLCYLFSHMTKAIQSVEEVDTAMDSIMQAMLAIISAVKEHKEPVYEALSQELKRNQEIQRKSIELDKYLQGYYDQILRMDLDTRNRLNSFAGRERFFYATLERIKKESEYMLMVTAQQKAFKDNAQLQQAAAQIKASRVQGGKAAQIIRAA
jgi:hypothetical protein